ncbi:MAG: RecQ family ATP-dependent DNA helicase [Bacteroidetes bacterium]|nr:RecQ family ATP-dependent DNA helicase [Bacteroidota bacterium]MCL6103773.1 RecQ family ATP-dependent DNA helicase [Bacteroidota bacterium]
MDLYHEILLKYWGFDSFRPLQEDIIHSVAAGKDTLGLMPTGGGKSITFQVFSLSTEGMCLVVTPLIALINDQVENLRAKGIKALAIYSGMTSREIEIACNNAVYGDYKFLYVSPERLLSANFLEYLIRFKLNLITVDEAHCISQWGYDFRPSYLQIANIRTYFPKVPILALTATATNEVVDDIQDKLLFPKKNLLKKSFVRENVTYLVRKKEDKLGYLVETVSKSKGSGIIYVRSRKKCREISDLLRQHEVSADFYHAGLDPVLRKEKQNNWMKGTSRVMVATNAFGMGIDKPDVRFVLHLDLPDSLEAYFQEAGRAGRDGERSVALMIYNGTDKRRLHKMVTDAFPEQERIRAVYQALCDYLQIAIGTGKNGFYTFQPEDFARKFSFPATTVYHSLKLMEREGYLEYTDDPETSSRLYFLAHRDELYRIETGGKNLEQLIGMLLRSYTGLFNDYVRIDEVLLARRLNITADELYQNLKYLSQQKIIHYIPRREAPVVQFLIERVEKGRIRISPANYQDRKANYQKRVDAVIGYACSEERCRSVQLLAYFGELGSKSCGQCDVCKGEHQSGISNIEFELISEKIRQLLLTGPMEIKEMIGRCEGNEKSILKVARWMLDQENLEINASNLLVLKK